jgi:hypothetical protein
LWSALAALDNAQAVDAPVVADMDLLVEQSPNGAGAAVPGALLTEAAAAERWYARRSASGRSWLRGTGQRVTPPPHPSFAPVLRRCEQSSADEPPARGRAAS